MFPLRLVSAPVVLLTKSPKVAKGKRVNDLGMVFTNVQMTIDGTIEVKWEWEMFNCT